MLWYMVDLGGVIKSVYKYLFFVLLFHISSTTYLILLIRTKLLVRVRTSFAFKLCVSLLSSYIVTSIFLTFCVLAFSYAVFMTMEYDI